MGRPGLKSQFSASRRLRRSGLGRDGGPLRTPQRSWRRRPAGLGRPAGDKPLVADDLLVDQVPPAFSMSRRTVGVGGQRPALHDVGLDQGPRPVADDPDRLARGEEVPTNATTSLLAGACRRRRSRRARRGVVVRGRRPLDGPVHLVAVGGIEVVVDCLGFAGLQTDDRHGRPGLLHRLCGLANSGSSVPRGASGSRVFLPCKLMSSSLWVSEPNGGTVAPFLTTGCGRCRRYPGRDAEFAVADGAQRPIDSETRGITEPSGRCAARLSAGRKVISGIRTSSFAARGSPTPNGRHDACSRRLHLWAGSLGRSDDPRIPA